MTMSPMAFHQYWQQRVHKEKKVMASHLGPIHAEKGIRLATPDRHDAEETCQEVLQGFYRTRSVPGLRRPQDEVVNGHVTLPRPRRINSASTAASSRSGGLCSHCDFKMGKSASSTGKRSAGSARLTGSAVLSNAGSRGPGRLGAGSRAASERSIGFYNNSQKLNDVPPLRSGPASIGGSESVAGDSVRLGSSASNSGSLQREVEALVRQEMERMVAPLQEELMKERQGRALAEQKIQALSVTGGN